mgnify:CR=1 FL=1
MYQELSSHEDSIASQIIEDSFSLSSNPSQEAQIKLLIVYA